MSRGRLHVARLLLHILARVTHGYERTRNEMPHMDRKARIAQDIADALLHSLVECRFVPTTQRFAVIVALGRGPAYVRNVHASEFGHLTSDCGMQFDADDYHGVALLVALL